MRRRHTIALAIASALVLSWVAAPARAAGGTTYTWIGSSQNSGADNHSWTDARNWSPNGVPQDGDSVVIQQPDGTHCTAHVDAVPTVSLVDLTVVQNPALCGTSVHGGTITVTGSLTWNGGNLDTPTVLAAGATGAVSGSNGRLNQLTQNLDIAGTLNLVGATGTAALQVAAPKIVHVQPTGTLAATGTNDITFTSCCVAPAKVVNDGTLSVSSGTLNVTAVELDQNHALDTGTGGQLVTTKAPITAGAGGTYAGSGRWLISNQGKARMTGTQTFGPDFHLELGGLDVGADAVIGGTATFDGTGTFDWTGGTVEADLTIGHGIHTKVTGVHINNGRRQLLGRDYTANAAGDPATVTNHGVFTLDQGATIGTGSTAKLVNASDGTLNLAPGTALTSGGCCVNPDKIVNAGGAVTVPAGSDTAPVVITNVAYQAAGGSVSVAAGRELQLAGGAPNRLDGTTISGGGRLTLAEPTAVSGTVPVGVGTHLALAPHGTLDGSATISGAGRFDWTGGSISGAVKIATTGGITVSGTAAKYLANVGGGSMPSALTLAAPTAFAAGTSAVHNILDLGASTLTLASSTGMAAYTDLRGGLLVNAGTLTVNPGAGGRVDKSGAKAVVNRGTVTVRSGTLYVGGYSQTAGSTSIAGGATLAGYSSSVVVGLAHGMLTGTGTVNAAVSNSAGTVAPGTNGTIGTLRITRTYAQGTGGRLLLDIASIARRDVLAVGGTTTVRGVLVVHDVGTYRPVLGAKVTVLSAGALHWSATTCTVSSGTGTSGTGPGHWVPVLSAVRLAVIWRSGAHTRC